MKDLQIRRHTPSRATNLSQQNRWRDTDWFKHAAHIKLVIGLNKSRVAPFFAVPRQVDRKGSRLETIFIPIGGPKANAKLVNSYDRSSASSG
jgi:hypothetical protein